MPEKWTGELLGKLHNAQITYDELAAELGVRKSYISMILNGHRKPEGARERLNSAYKSVLEKRKQAEAQTDGTTDIS